MDTPAVTELILHRYADEIPAFVQTGDAGRVTSVGFDRVDLPLPGQRSVGVPVPELNPEYLTSRPRAAEYGDDEAFLLELVLAKDEVSVDALNEVLVTVPVERSLGTLTQQGVVDTDGDRVGLVPQRLHATAGHLRGRQLMSPSPP